MRRLEFVLVVLVVTSLVLVGCGAPTPTPTPLPAPTKAAEPTKVSPTAIVPTAVPPTAVPPSKVPEPTKKPSGTITMYTSESQDLVNEMKLDFERLNPGITLNIFRSGSGPVVSKIQAEMQAGKIQADLIWFADIAFFQDLAAKGLFLKYTPEEAKGLPKDYIYEGGLYHEVRLIFNCVGYNTNLVKTPPTSWKDLLDPKYKGKVVVASPNYSGAAFSTLGTLVHMPEFGWDFYKGLKANGARVEQSNGTVTQKLAAGEFALASCVDFMVRNLKRDGSPVDYVYPSEGAVLIPTPLAIIKDTANPEAAKAFLRYTLSADGQKFFVKQGYLPVMPGIDPPANTPALSTLKLAPSDWTWIQNNRDSLKKEYSTLFEEAQ